MAEIEDKENNNDKEPEFFDMIEEELNCTICGNYMGHIVVRRDVASDNKIIDGLNLFAKPSGVEIVCPTCWVTNVQKRGFHRLK